MRSFTAAVPVISVGNITTGGTGKTPVVAWVVRQLQQGGEKNPAIVTRGYKAVAGVSDEATLLKRLTGATVLVNPDRLAGAATAVGLGADVIVMDDGFQYLRLRRDLDIVTIDATCPFGYEAVLPRGMLREPVRTLRYADVVVITRCDQVGEEDLSAVRRRLAALAGCAEVAESVMKPVALAAFNGTSQPPSCLTGRPIWAFCGLANGDAFFRTLESLGSNLIGRSSFNDHHAYTTADVALLRERSQAAGAAMLVTTAKDAVKLAGVPLTADIHWLEIEVAFREGEEKLKLRIQNAARAAAAAK